jgi:hypothetical protein
MIDFHSTFYYLAYSNDKNDIAYYKDFQITCVKVFVKLISGSRSAKKDFFQKKNLDAFWQKFLKIFQLEILFVAKFYKIYSCFIYTLQEYKNNVILAIRYVNFIVIVITLRKFIYFLSIPTKVPIMLVRLTLV